MLVVGIDPGHSGGAVALAALYVEEDTVYRSIGLDCWPESRDARRYAGPYRVIAHPPCTRWSTLAHIHGRIGEDGGLFAHALEVVRKYGGVLEHPEGSAAWPAYQLPRPGWMPDKWGGWTLRVDQCWWGHPCRKRTLLYFVGVSPSTITLPTSRPKATTTVEMQSSTGIRRQTPPSFARWLVAMVSGAGQTGTPKEEPCS